MKSSKHAYVVFLFIILYASFSRFISASSAAISKELKGNNEEAFALFKWKTSLYKESQSSLSSWEITDLNPSNHCGSWFGISCNKAGRVHNITIHSYGLKRIIHRKQTSDRQRGNSENVFSIWSYDGKLVYENIIDETKNFDEKYCIGIGGSGAVYKVELPDSQVYAVKKLHDIDHGELNSEKTFMSEIQALAKIRHRNIIKLYGFCSHTRHSFLVYEFLEGGALQEILSDEKKATNFEWTKRVDIIKGVANGLSYMHHECSPPIVHRDISSKNILLDEEYVAHISDFGTARILKTNSTNCTSFAGTFGYAAPELAYTMEVNEMQDVYSFGVLILEVLMGRHPGDLVSSHFTTASSSSMTATNDDLKHTLLKDVLDPRLRFPMNNRESEEIVCCLKLAFACLQYVPHHRPTMKQVSTGLSKFSLSDDNRATLSFRQFVAMKILTFLFLIFLILCGYVIFSYLGVRPRPCRE